MVATFSPRQSYASADQWPPELSDDAEPVDLDRHSRQRPSFRKRASRALVRFVITFGIGIAATLGWQSYGDTAREMVATASPQLAWLAPQPAPVEQAAAETVAQAAPVAQATPSADPQELKALSFGLAAMRQSVDQLAARLAAGQQQMAVDIAKLQVDEQDILNKISAPPPSPRPAAVAARKPPPPPPPVALSPAPAAH